MACEASESSRLLAASGSDYDDVPSPDHPPSFSAGRSRYSGWPSIVLAIVGAVVGLLWFAPALHTHTSLRPGLSTSDTPLLGKAKGAKSKADKKGDVLDEDYDCAIDDGYSKHTLKNAYDLPYAALFRDTRGQTKFEASDVTIVGDEVYSVCDSSWAISKFTRDLSPFSEENVQIGDPDRNPDEDSGYEAIFHHENLFYVVRESVFHADHNGRDEGGSDDDDDNVEPGSAGDYHAVIEELDIGEDDYTVVRQCQCEFEFEGDSKGFEGAVGFPDANGDLYVLGLCEGNHCSEERKKEVGNGRVVLMRKKEEDVNAVDVTRTSNPGECLWETVRVVKIPKSAAFLEYSAIDITANGRVAIASQEYSAVWLGHAVGITDGVIDPDAFAFHDDDSSVLQFPKDGGCHTVYCNVEGIHFMDDEMLMAVSDKMKSKGRQDFRCHEKDQSIHAFVIP
ncbi:hypothetical protein ACHAXT_011649 [Thalassiosira profunda]